MSAATTNASASGTTSQEAGCELTAGLDAKQRAVSEQPGGVVKRECICRSWNVTRKCKLSGRLRPKECSRARRYNLPAARFVCQVKLVTPAGMFGNNSTVLRSWPVWNLRHGKLGKKGGSIRKQLAGDTKAVTHPC